MKHLVVALLLSLGAIAHAESHDSIVKRAFDALDDDFPEGWSFTETVENGEGSSIARYDPTLSEANPWTLLSIDGREPTEKETRQFQERKARRREAREADEGRSPSVDDMVARGTLTLREETDTHWEFGFTPAANSKEGAEFMRHVDGTLWVRKDGHYVSLIRLRNRETLKPGKGVRIESFDTRLEFGPAFADGPILPLLVQSAVRGKAMLMIRFDENERIRYSDFKPVADQAGSRRRGSGGRDALHFMDDAAIRNRQQDPGLVNGVRIDLEDVLVERDQIRFLSDLDGSDPVFHVQHVGRAHGVSANQRFDAQPLADGWLDRGIRFTRYLAGVPDLDVQ